MAKVIIPQMPSRFDQSLKMWVPTISVKSAEKFGEIVTLLPPEASRVAPAPLFAALRERVDEVVSDGDYLIAVGDPTILAATAVLMTRKSGGTFRVLRWDRMTSSYIAVEAKL